MEISPDQLLGTWRHSHEESHGDRIVLRPADFAFPASRGRRGITLRDRGVAEVEYPGPTDRTARALGRWALEGKRLMIDALGWSGTFEIEIAGKEMLVLRKRAQ